jgi:hypothetical protein
VCSDFNFASDATVVHLNKAIAAIDPEKLEPYECGMDIDGNLHDEREECRNMDYDAYIGEEFCKVHRLENLRRRREELQLLPSLLAYYWQHGLETKGFAFLRRMGYVYSYE